MVFGGARTEAFEPFGDGSGTMGRRPRYGHRASSHHASYKRVSRCGNGLVTLRAGCLIERLSQSLGDKMERPWQFGIWAGHILRLSVFPFNMGGVFFPTTTTDRSGVDSQCDNTWVTWQRFPEIPLKEHPERVQVGQAQRGGVLFLEGFPSGGEEHQFGVLPQGWNLERERLG